MKTKLFGKGNVLFNPASNRYAVVREDIYERSMPGLNWTKEIDAATVFEYNTVEAIAAITYTHSSIIAGCKLVGVTAVRSVYINEPFDNEGK